jgi:hypothetical protein
MSTDDDPAHQHMSAPIRVHWQYCRGDDDITSDWYAVPDADEARVWDGDVCLLAVVRDRDQDRWRIESSNCRLPDGAYDEVFATPTAALEYLAARRGFAYQVTTGDGWADA